MRQAIYILSYFVTVTLLLVLQKPVFAAYVGGFSAADVCAAMWHGVPMDMSVAGYLSVIQALAAMASIWLAGKWIRTFTLWYTAISSLAIAAACTANAALYPYWHFPLDYTPIFYLTTSPEAALASISAWQIVAGCLATVALAVAYFFALRYVVNMAARIPCRNINKLVSTALMLVICGLLFVVIRGGVTVSTMNLSRVYFSSDMRLNHLAVNPVFSFLYSATHQGSDDSPFRYLDDSDAEAIFEAMNTPSDSSLNTQHSTLTTHHWTLDTGHWTFPDIHLIIAESFSDNLLPSLGGEDIAVRLDQIGREGWMFSDAYASSFRTDRALTAILCGYPALPTTSLLKYVDKIDRLPSLPRALKNAGYELAYYYGGDINFTNVNAMLMAAGFDRIVSDKDFPVSEKLSKWGAPDHAVMRRALAELPTDTARCPRLTVVQTSSSHEPFDVPDIRRHADDRVNAFMYADSVIGNYVDSLKARGDYANALVVIVADHYGAYPDTDDPLRRHRIPLIITGGAIDGLDRPEALGLPASQTDIAATILAMLGLDHSAFRFSNNLLAHDRHPYAVFSEPTWAAIVDDGGFAKIDIGGNLPPGGDALASPGLPIGTDKITDSAAIRLAAYMQTVYNDFSSR